MNRLKMFAIITMAIFAMSAEAKSQELTVEFKGLMANIEQFDKANTGWELGVGVDGGWWRTVIATGEHQHLNNATNAVWVMQYVETDFTILGQTVTPYGGLGGGYSFNPDRPIAHLEVGVAVEIAESWSLTMGGTYRYYFGPFGEDGMINVGFRKSFDFPFLGS